MTRIAHGNHPDVPHELTLSLRILENGNIHWSYSEKVIILDAQPKEILIVLKNETHLEAEITSYASTGVSHRHSPIKSHKLNRDGKSIEIQIGLLPNQLIDFGVFVHVWGNGVDKTIFCDPQASNDPIKTP